MLVTQLYNIIDRWNMVLLAQTQRLRKRFGKTLAVT